MILQVPADAPLVIKAAAAGLLFAHIGGASLGLVSGTTAMLARKGDRLHRLSGNVFFAAMLSMGAAAAITAPLMPDRISAVMGVLVVYLTLTAWLAVHPPSVAVRRLQVGALALALGVVVADLALATIGGRMPNGVLDGEPSQLGYVFAIVAGLAAVCDLKVIRAGRVLGAPRVRRHLWRMSTALAIAWGSFAGQPKAQPEALRGSPLLALPALVTLALLFFWMLKTRSTRAVAVPAALAPAQEALS